MLALAVFKYKFRVRRNVVYVPQYEQNIIVVFVTRDVVYCVNLVKNYSCIKVSAYFHLF